MWKQTDFIPALIAQFGPQKIKRISLMLLVLPLIAIMIICGIYIAYWRTDPWIRFTHMLWVLGFWMAGTVAMFASIIPARLKLGLPIPVWRLRSSPSRLPLYSTGKTKLTIAFGVIYLLNKILLVLWRQ